VTPGRGKKVVRCALPEALIEQLRGEAKNQHIELGAVIEGHIAESMRKRDGYLTMIERRLDQLSRQQEHMLTLLEALVTTFEQGQRSPQAATEEAVPVATYEQLYGPPKTPAEPPTEQAAPAEVPKGGWWRRR
jgi:hypothetical protein